MIPRGVEIYVGLDPIDLRWGFERLCGTVNERMARRARSGAVFVFFGRRRHAIKVFFFDGTGLCVFYKRLDKGTFRLPTNYDPQSRSVAINERMLEELLSGIDLDIPTTH